MEQKIKFLSSSSSERHRSSTLYHLILITKAYNQARKIQKWLTGWGGPNAIIRSTLNTHPQKKAWDYVGYCYVLEEIPH